MFLMNSIIQPTVLYGSEVWGPCLLEFDRAMAEKVQTYLLQCIIKCKQTISTTIILLSFVPNPFDLRLC
jgi:hypothetical protein